MKTADECAAEVAFDAYAGCYERPLTEAELAAQVAAAIRSFVLMEREACARIAEEMEQVHPAFQERLIPLNLRQQIAAAIRGR